VIPGYGAPDGDVEAWAEPGEVHEQGEEGPPPAFAPVLVSLASVKPERLTWLWEGRLPAGKIVTLDGDPSVGKSTLAVDLAAHVSTGTVWPDGAPCERGAVLILSAEDGLADTIRPRLDAAGGDPARVHALTGVRAVQEDGEVGERPLTLADITTIAAAVRQTSARLVIVDVMMAFLPGKVDSHKDQDIRAVLGRLTRIGEETGCTFLLLRHLNKAGGSSPMYRGGGSIGIVGAARAGYLVARDPEDPDTRVLACVKSNLAREPESLTYRLESAPGGDVARVVWTGSTGLDAASLLRTDGEDDERHEVDAWLLDLLDGGNGAVPAQDVKKKAHAAGYSLDQVKRAKKRLGIESVKAGMGGGWEWVAPLEGGTKGAKGAAPRVPPPSLPSALPSADARAAPADTWRVSGLPAWPAAEHDPDAA
jgi:AAA domain